MKNVIKNTFKSSFFIVLIIVSIAIVLIPILKEPLIDFNTLKKDTDPDYSFKDVHLKYTTKGSVKWDLKAKKSSIDFKKNTFDFTEISGNIFDKKEESTPKNSKSIIHYKSPGGYYENNEHILILNTPILSLLNIEPKLDFYANIIKWNEANQWVKGIKNVKAKHPQYNITAESFQFKSKLSKSNFYWKY